MTKSMGVGRGNYPGNRLPKGRKVYPEELTTEVRRLYDIKQMSQKQIAILLGRSLRFVQGVMRAAGVKPRKAAPPPGSRTGPKSPSWKGVDAGYQAKHLRVETLYGTPSECRKCGTTAAEKTYDWANLTGNYDDTADFMRMCRSCHRKYDRSRRAASQCP